MVYQKRCFLFKIAICLWAGIWMQQLTLCYISHQLLILFFENKDLSLSSLCGEYNRLSISKASFIVHRTRQKYYYQGDRPSRLLILRLKENKFKSCIDVIWTAEGKITDPKAINYTLKSFYSKLYSSETKLNEILCKTYLDESITLSYMRKQNHFRGGSLQALMEFHQNYIL